MAKMSLGSYTFETNPSQMTKIPVKKRKVSYIETHTDIAVFSYGASFAGKIFELSWLQMSPTQYAQLASLFIADSSVVFDPQDGSGSTFNVEILDFSAEYHRILDSSSANIRKNGYMKLLILSEV